MGEIENVRAAGDDLESEGDDRIDKAQGRSRHQNLQKHGSSPDL
jgi:hypothetical protein